MRRLTVLVDMDGTIAGFNNRIEVVWNELHPDKLAPTICQLTNWRTDEVYASLHGDEASIVVRRIYQGPEFFNKLEPLPGAIDAIKEMAEEHDVFFCSSPVGSYLHCLHDKFAWIETHFGKAWTQKIILTHDKTLVRGDILIDDKPKITGMLQPTWKHVYYTQAYNADLDGPRVTNWENWRVALATVMAA